MTKKKAIKVGHKGAARRIISKIEEELEKETTQRDEIESLCETLKKKRDTCILSDLHSEILEEIAEENMEAEIQDSDRMSEDDDKIETMETDQNVYTTIGEIIDIERYNSYRKLTHITAYVMKFAAYCRATENERKILRCGGRRKDNATVAETVKSPYLLTAKDRLTHLIVLESFTRNLCLLTYLCVYDSLLGMYIVKQIQIYENISIYYNVMAQVLAVPGDVRHGFIYTGKFKHQFGRITGIAATTKGNILLCDYDYKSLTLVDPTGTHLRTLNLDSEPLDVAITSQNIGYITQPNTRSVIQIDPDRMIILIKVGSDNVISTMMCASAVQNTGRDIPNKVPCYISLKHKGCVFAVPVNKDNSFLPDNIPRSSWEARTQLDTRLVKLHAVDENTFYSCIGGQNYIKVSKRGTNIDEHICKIETMEIPTDKCSDNHGHIYVSGQGSNNIHRLTQDGKVLDIPLNNKQYIKEPVALCFNKNYTKLYIVNEWGKCVLVFDVV
ncbi:unnamed protein product [Mytilus coruscus]|uniref:TRIM2_3 n=1 Tax=Mytilus coruscus TaxID=42192 RepID=A0A6J8CM08_MYTCO|nr:unnamed protein product [Mytilus coruscus]